MGRITQELLRKRAEHNDGILTTLEEISLHQENIERIENLEYYCRHIKILYLQDNIIEKLESIEEENDDDEFYLNEIKENDGNQDNKTKNMKLTRKKLSQIRVKAGIIKFKETDEVVHDNFKNNFDIGLKKFENEDDTPKDFHASLNLLELKKNKSDINTNTSFKPRSIFEVLSVSKESNKK